MTDNQVLAQNLKIFSLIRLKADCKILPVRVDFAPPHMYLPLSLRPNTPPTSIVPSYNRDACFFTPAFLLPTDKVRTAPNPEILPGKCGLLEIPIRRKGEPESAGGD
jgi:hypothetical protein